MLEREGQLGSRVTSAESAMMAVSESTPPPSKEVWASCEADFAQIMEICDEVTQVACDIRRRRAGESVPPAPSPAGGAAIVGRLPTIQLGSFDGCVEEWVAYRNMFVSLVDSRDDLTRGQKMAYLMSTLQGEARALVQHLRVEDSQYATAWELLTNRYHNVRLLADAHARQLLSLPGVHSRADLRLQLLTPVTVACNALKTLGLPVEQWSFILVHIILTKLPTDIRSRFEREAAERDGSALPTLEDLLRFLEYEARVVETSPPELPPLKALPCRCGTTQGRRTPQAAQQQRAPGRTTARLTALTTAAGREPACLQCGQMGHPLLRCTEWRGLPLADRRRMAKRNGLCFGCLGDHFARDCPRAQRCSACGGSHHLLLCANRSDAAPPTPQQRRPTVGGAPGWSTSPPPWRRSPARDASPPREVSRGQARAPMEGHASAGYQAAGSSVSWGPMGGGPTADRRSPPASAPVRASVEQRDSPGPRRFSPPLHEYPRLEYHPPYHRYGRAAGYAPPSMATCTRRPYFYSGAKGEGDAQGA